MARMLAVGCGLCAAVVYAAARLSCELANDSACMRGQPGEVVFWMRRSRQDPDKLDPPPPGMVIHNISGVGT